MDGIASVTARIGQIESRISALSGPPQGVRADTSGGISAQAMDFAAALDSSKRSAASKETTRAAEVGSGKSLVNAKNVPLEYLQHPNGKLPLDVLSKIEGSDHRLWAPAARSFEALRAAAKKDGVTIGITDSYRTYETQVDLVRRKGLYSKGGLAAAPGTSNHGWGMALDLRLDSKAQAWMRENAGEFGFVEDVPREPWHWGYHPTH